MNQKGFRFMGCKPSKAGAQCDECGTQLTIVHSIDLTGTAVSKDVCLTCAEDAVIRRDKGMPTEAEAWAKRGGPGIGGWVSRWHLEDMWR